MAITDRRGGALLTVLWLSAALSAIAFAVAHTVRGETERVSTAADGIRSYYLATGAIQRALLHMIWAGPYYAPGTPALHLVFPSGETWVEIIPETAKLNANTSPAEDLFRLLINLGVGTDRAREIVLAIVDWRTPAPDLTAFDQFYLLLSPSFRARHASFEEIEELLLIKGMTPDLYYGTYERDPQSARLVPRGGLRECVSVFGATDRFDINTAHPAVLATAGIPPELIAAIVERRRVQPFVSLAEISSLGPEVNRLRIGGNSMYTLRATARLKLPDGQMSDLRRTVAATVKFMPPGADAPYHVVRWYE